MFVRLIELGRDGAIVPKWQQYAMTPHEGQLVIGQYDDEELRRTMRQARLVNLDNRDVVPPLLDSAVIYYRENIMRISGLQQQGLPPNRYVMQTWHIEVVAVYYCTGEALRHKLMEGKPPNYDWTADAIAQSIPPHKRGKTI